MFMQTHQDILYLKDIFHNVHLRFLDALGHLWNHPALVDDTKTTIPGVPNSQYHLKRIVLSGLGEIAMSTFWKWKFGKM